MSMLDRPDNRVAGFVLKGQLAETALTRAMGTRTGGAEVSFHSISQRLSIKDLDAEAVTDAEKMSAVYIAIASFENMVRKLISDRLLEEKGADWWKECVSVKIRDTSRNSKTSRRSFNRTGPVSRTCFLMLSGYAT